MNESKPLTFDDWLEAYLKELGLRDTWGEFDVHNMCTCWDAAQASARQEDAITMFNLQRK